MKLFTLLATAAIAAATAVSGLGPSSGLVVRDDIPSEGGFVKHCYTYTVGERGELVGRLIGQCSDDESFNWLHDTWLDLNLCLGNNNGYLIWKDSGNAIAGSCKDCASRKFDTQWIECRCRDGAGQWRNTSLDLDVGIRYDPDANVMACFGHLGVLDEPTA